jgi:hypothetical protein
MILLSLKKLYSFKTLVDLVETYVNKNYNLPISNKFLTSIFTQTLEIDTKMNLRIKDMSTEDYYNYDKLFVDFFGISIKKIVTLSFEFKDVNYDKKPINLVLNKEIKLLEDKVQILNEIIDELRDSYVRIKRENEKLLTKR